MRQLKYLNDTLLSDQLKGLSKEEKIEVLKILKEYSETGQSSSLNTIVGEDYEEIPVDIHTFLHDSKYLGKALTNEEGKFTLFPYWESLLEEIYPDPLQPAKYNTLALTGAIGLGKSTEAVIIGAYELYRMLCLKDPYMYYGLQPIDLITFAVINITKDAAKGVAWSKLQGMIQASEWFMSHGEVNKADVPEWKPPKGIELIYGSQTRHVIGRAVYWSFIDEVSFQANQDVNKQIEKAKALVNTVTARMQSRFMKGSYNPTIFVLASSKRTEQSFMETFIANKKKNDSKTTRIVDEPQWVIRTDKDSEEKFKVAVGNRYLNNEILPLNITEEEVQQYLQRGFTIINVPIGYYENFIDDIDIALTDIAGISTSNVTRYIAGSRLSLCRDDNYQNLFTKEIITVGNAADDKAQYYDFIDLSRLDEDLKLKPLYIHLDMSVSGDKTGIAGVWILGKKPPKPGEPDSKALYYKLAFHVSIKAPKGYQISFEKNRQLLYWLREQGFNIQGVSTDSYQSADMAQTLIANRFKYEQISVDRVQDLICKPYQYFKSTIYEERIKIYPNSHLTEEIIGLVRDNNSGKVDHSEAGINSKDSADGVAGALWNASQHADEFSFYFGEDLDNTLSVSQTDSSFTKTQIQIDMNNELKKIMEFRQPENNNFIDFGLGKAKRLSNQMDAFYLSQGIIL